MRAADRPQLWLYYPINFLVDKNLDNRRAPLVRSAVKSGAAGVGLRVRIETQVQQHFDCFQRLV